MSISVDHLYKNILLFVSSIKYKLYNLKSNIYFKPFIAWVIWIFFGSVYYAYQDENGWSKGFYMAVNVGYNIGWGYPTESNNDARVFSIFYLLIGSSAIATSLAFFAKSMILSSKDWYTKALRSERLKLTSSNFMEYIISWLLNHENTIKAIAAWILWILSMVIFALVELKWDFIQALYFAVSCLSTGGLYPIPSNSPDWYFLFVGIFTCTGVPITCIAMGSIASLLLYIGDPEEAEKTLQRKVTPKELKMMQRFNIDDGDGIITRAEYILLCAVRLGAVSPEFIEKINERFEELDHNKDGTLTYMEILEKSPSMKFAANTLSSILFTDYSPIYPNNIEHSRNSYQTQDNNTSLKINTDII